MTYSPRARVIEILESRGIYDAEEIAGALDVAGVLADEPHPCPAYISGETIVARCYLPAGHDGPHVTAWDGEETCGAFDDLIGRCDRYHGHPGWHGRETALGATLVWPSREPRGLREALRQIDEIVGNSATLTAGEIAHVRRILLDEGLQADTEAAACCTYHKTGGAIGHECSPDYGRRRRAPIRRER